MPEKSWHNPIGVLIAAGALLVCLALGVFLGMWLAPKPAIGLVRFEGAIDLSSAESLVSTLENARHDDRVAGVVLELASPGGLATSSESIYYTLLNLRAEKPIVAVVDGIAVSGGYYIASAANRIIAPASAYVGNVGTRGPRPDDPSLAAEEMSSGPYKLSGGSRFDRVEQLDRVKESFVGAVVHQRQHADANPLRVDADTVAEARIYLGSEAVALGLADAEGSRSDGIAAVAELAGLRDYKVIDLLKDPGVSDSLLQPDYRSSIKHLVETAPPDAVFLIDSRIPLPGLDDSSELERHMLHLRSISPASLDSIPMAFNTESLEPAGAGSRSEVPTPHDDTSVSVSGEQP
jgi:protease-4